MRLVAPSMLSADFLRLKEDVDFVNAHGDLFHLDVMDGSFVPNISFGFPVVEAIAKEARRPMDVHLMIENPQKYIARFAKTGAAMISFHLEAARKAGEDPARLLASIRNMGVKAGLAINPDIPVEELYPYVEEADFVLLMSVFAGFGGQSFLEDTHSRLRALKTKTDGSSCIIEVDGGINTSNASLLAASGAQILVAGSAIFNAPDRETAFRTIKGD